MEPRTAHTLLILADISGYTRFMLASRLSMVHGQQVITALIESILAEVEMPLEVQEIEGDAVFLYAVHPGDEAGWNAVCEQVGRKLLRLFESFTAALVAESESTVCRCEVCHNLHQLKLKIVVHSGEALFHQIDRFADLSGVDVILAHRLLKNSVDSDEYILMTEPAWGELRFDRELQVTQGHESYEGFGSVPIRVHRLDGSWEQSRQDFLNGPVDQVLRTTLSGGFREVVGQFTALVRHGPAGAVWILLLMTPIQLLVSPLFTSIRALTRRRRRWTGGP